MTALTYIIGAMTVTAIGGYLGQGYLRIAMRIGFLYILLLFFAQLRDYYDFDSTVRNLVIPVQYLTSNFRTILSPENAELIWFLGPQVAVTIRATKALIDLI